MKPENIDQTLREWKLGASLPPRFQERVWQKIAREESRSSLNLWVLLKGRISGMLARPSMAVGYVALLLFTGLLAGYWQARAEQSHTLEDLGARYVQMMDPYQAHR
jgi:hypothetical protein